MWRCRLLLVLVKILLAFWVDKCGGPGCRGPLRLNELESSRTKVRVNWRQSLAHSAWPEILQASFTLKSFPALREARTFGPLLSARWPLSLLFIWSFPPQPTPIRSRSFSLLLSTFLACPRLRTFLIPPPPLPAALLWAWVNQRNEGDRYTDGRRGEKREEKYRGGSNRGSDCGKCGVD